MNLIGMHPRRRTDGVVTLWMDRERERDITNERERERETERET